MSAETPEQFGRDYFQNTYGISDLRPFSQHWWAVRFYAGMSRRLLRRMNGRKMLDFGCGYGFILSALQDEFETYGLDISEYAIEQCGRVTPKSKCAVANIDKGLPEELFETGTFDLVLACYVFEHLHDPLAAMHKLARLLRPGGVLFFSVPNTESLGARWKGDAWYALQDPTHCSLLPPDRWLEYAALSGLVLECETSDGYWDLPYIKWLPKWLQFPFFVAPSALCCLLARPILPERFGENVIVIARKPAEQE